MAMGLTQPLTKISTRNISGGKERLAHEADITVIGELNASKMWGLKVSQPYGPPQAVTGIPLPLFLLIFNSNAPLH
jgi:hypothetical protein